MDLRELQANYLAKEREVTDKRIQQGALILTVLSEEDGMVFKNGRTGKPKRMIIIGVDTANDICYGSVLVNTKMSPKPRFSDEYLSAQYMLSQKDYPEFLDYDSYADCGELFSISIRKLKQGVYFGILKDKDMRGVMDIWKPLIPFQQNKRNALGLSGGELHCLKFSFQFIILCVSEK